MTLYEIHAYPTQHYDRAAEKHARLRAGHGLDKLTPWIAAYLAEHPDGKVVVSIVERQRTSRRGGKARKVFVETTAGKEFV